MPIYLINIVMFFQCCIGKGSEGQENEKRLNDLQSRNPSLSDYTIGMVDSCSVKEFIFGTSGAEGSTSIYKLKKDSTGLKLFNAQNAEGGYKPTRDSLDFGKDVSRKDRTMLGSYLLEEFPVDLLELGKDVNFLGCPYCRDGGAIYLEVVFLDPTKKSKKILIDYIGVYTELKEKKNLENKEKILEYCHNISRACDYMEYSAKEVFIRGVDNYYEY